MDSKTNSDVKTSLKRAAEALALQSRRLIVLEALDTSTDPNRQKKIYRLNKERIVIGSVISADVRLSGDGVAPIHAVVEAIRDPQTGEDSTTLYDLASETGVFVGGQKIITHALKTDDVITVGRHQLRFGLHDAEVSVPRNTIQEAEGRKFFVNADEAAETPLIEDVGQIEEIFDYRPTQKQAIEVIMSWNGTILSIEHFVEGKTITIGSSRGNDFAIPPGLATQSHPLIRRDAGSDSAVLQIDDKMSGVLQRGGKLQTFEDLRSTLMRTSQGFAIAFGKEDFAKFTVGEVDFYISNTAAPPRLKLKKMFERDPLFFKFFASSMVLTAVAITGLLNAPVPQAIEAEQVPERIATILYQPEKYADVPKVYESKQTIAPAPEPVKAAPKTEKPKPLPVVKLDLKPNAKNLEKPIPKEMTVAKPMAKSPKTAAKAAGAAHSQNQAKEGEGAKAKGTEGTRGTKNAKPSDQKQNLALRPSPQGGQGSGGGKSQVADEGNVDFLKSATGRIENILGNSAAQLGKGGEKLKGFGGFDTQGGGGLALSGSGKGGGGDAASLGGLGDKGRGGGKVGTGRGAMGNGSGIVGGMTRVSIRTGGPEEAVLMGSIDADAVEAALLAHRDEFRLCYEKEINAETPKLAGRVGTNFVIGPSGRVTQAGIDSTTLKNANVERCILGVIKRIDFPIPRGAGLVQVTYPFKFNPVGG